MTFLLSRKGIAQRPAPALVIAASLVALQKINRNLCQERFLYKLQGQKHFFFLPRFFYSPLPSALVSLLYTAKGVVVYISFEFEINV